MPERYDWRDFSPAALAESKNAQGLKVTVCVPARNEETTVAGVVSAVRHELVDRHSLVDELVVVDDGSTDDTARRAETAGASVVRLQPGGGKGQAMRRGLEATTGELVVYCDADVLDFQASFVFGLLGPLLTDASKVLVKAAYRRPLNGKVGEGGRVTELVAKPLLRLLFPGLATLDQPLSGEWAGRRGVLEELDFAPGYGVELGVLIDVAARFGLGSVAETDLGERHHRNRPLSELAPMADTVMRLGLERAGLLPLR